MTDPKPKLTFEQLKELAEIPVVAAIIQDCVDYVTREFDFGVRLKLRDRDVEDPEDSDDQPT